jgi:MFS family permease
LSDLEKLAPAPHPKSSPYAEFRSGWPVVVTAALGSALGISGLFTYTSGLFVIDLERELGLSRTSFGLAFFASTVAIALTMPLVGKIFDERGLRGPLALGSLMLALGFGALALVTSVAFYFAAMVAIGLFASLSTPVGYTRAVSVTFRRARGLALGFTQMGIGLAAALVPPLITAVIIAEGWRAGFAALALLASLGAIPALVGFRQFPQPATKAADTSAEFGEVARSSTFRLQFAAFVLMALSFAGMLPHFVPMLRDLGVDPLVAGAYAGAIGLSVIVSRLIVGWLADRVHAPWIAAGACILCGLGCLLLAIGGSAMALPGAIALGAAMGAEADLVGFMTAHHFGVRVYGRAYAWQYAGFILAAGASPAWVGAIADATGGYRLALIICAAGLAVTCLLFLALPRQHQPA